MIRWWQDEPLWKSLGWDRCWTAPPFVCLLSVKINFFMFIFRGWLCSLLVFFNRIFGNRSPPCSRASKERWVCCSFFCCFFWHWDKHEFSANAQPYPKQYVFGWPFDIHWLVVLLSFFTFIYPLKLSPLSPAFFFLALFLLFCLLSCHYLISSLSSPSFFTPLCSWFSILFMKSCSPRVCLNCILEKKAPHNPGSSQSKLTKHYFHRLCLHDCVGLVVVDAVKYEACFFYLEYLFSLKLFSNF